MALVYALSHILWRAGQELGRCYVCLPQDSELFDPTPHYHHDGLTEKVSTKPVALVRRSVPI